MQEIIGIRDKLKREVEELDGGYATIAKLLKTSTSNVHKTLGEQNIPRLTTLETIKDAVDTARKKQLARISQLNA
ncbi:hypothetical protein [Spirosoma endbachense]|uniref:DNA-binding protein n=1 Tax=Spirosoma endbachense TaxID=2666025 RepID=A0A6P1VSX0_9BACT|nr:hypothetical protein [Spirosoma endbachense]QHV96331.1 hypothetical protein GJR95_15465 [Spirosoma endbachense]